MLSWKVEFNKLEMEVALPLEDDHYVAIGTSKGSKGKQGKSSAKESPDKFRPHPGGMLSSDTTVLFWDSITGKGKALDYHIGKERAICNPRTKRGVCPDVLVSGSIEPGRF